jgi:copper chaperone
MKGVIRMKKKFIIDGMGCEACVRRIKGALSNIEEIKVDVVEIGNVIVEISNDNKDQEVVEAIEDLGFDVRHIQINN